MFPKFLRFVGMNRKLTDTNFTRFTVKAGEMLGVRIGEVVER